MSTNGDINAYARWQWHPEAREAWANERLYFWRIHFPTYERQRFLDNVQEVMRRTGVLAYAVYELYGGFDMLLRVWLPTTQGVFEATFTEVFGRDPNIVIEGFAVTEIVSHWPWPTGPDGGVAPLGNEILKNRASNRKLEALNIGEVDLSTTYEGRGLLAKTDHASGIKFAIAIGTSRHWMPMSSSQRVQQTLVDILRSAPITEFSEKSLYKGLGFASYLLLGRTTAFHSIENELTQPINALVASETGARTTTFVVSTQRLLAFSEAMRLTEEPPPKRSAKEWLLEDESQRLEVKGSAFTDLHDWLVAQNDDGSPPRNDIPIESLCKAIVGMLNAEGGAVIVGALETKRYGDSPRLERVLRVGDYVIWGIRSDMGKADWDEYARRLREVIGTRVKPDPNVFLEIEKDGIRRRPLAVISVRPPIRTVGSEQWFYQYPKTQGDGRPRFWVREGNRTKEKAGPEIDAYKSEKTRRAAGGGEHP
jgi:hypothetical protein